MKEPRDGAFLDGREILRRKNGHPLLFTDWTWQLCPPGSDRCTSLILERPGGGGIDPETNDHTHEQRRSLTNLDGQTKLRQRSGKTVIDGLVALLILAGVGAFVWFGGHHHPVLAVVVGVPVVVAGLSAFRWVADHDDRP